MHAADIKREGTPRTVALKLAHHQFHVDLLARDVPQLQRLAHGHARVFLTVRDREGHRNLLSVVQRRDALEKRADVREPLVAVLQPPLVAPPVRRILEEGDPVGDAEVGEPACDLGGKVHEGGLFVCGPRESKGMHGEREKERNGSDINHVPAICRERRGSKGWKNVMRTGIRTRSAHDGYARGDKLVLHILVDVVQESSDVPSAKTSAERHK